MVTVPCSMPVGMVRRNKRITSCGCASVAISQSLAFFFKKKLYELVDATIPNDIKEFKVELVINKRLAIINEIKITGLEKEGYTLYLKYIR